MYRTINCEDKVDNLAAGLRSLRSSTRSLAVRVFWMTTAICLGLSALALISVSGSDFHYKSQQTAALNVIGYLIMAWIVISGISGALIVLMPRPTEQNAQRIDPPIASAATRAPPRPRRFPVLTGISVFLIIVVGDLYVNHGAQIALVLPMACIIAIWAGYREKRRA